MLHIHQAQSKDDRSYVRELFWEYLEWANGRVNEELGVNFDIKTMLEDDMAELEIFSPPDGRVLLAFDESDAAGLGCLKRIRADTGEIKRMYVRPQFRGKGFGRALLKALLDEAREAGYSRVRLDSARFMKAAHSLYRSAGFRKIKAYPESEIPPEFQQNWIFMEKQL